MRQHSCIWLFVCLLGAVAAAAPPQVATQGEKYLGTWSGAWVADASSGGIEVVLEKGSDGAVAGRVSVTGQPAYKADFKTLTFDGPRMTAVYDFPNDPSVEVRLIATFESESVKGTWAARQKGGDADVAAGTWTASRKS